MTVIRRFVRGYSLFEMLMTLAVIAAIMEVGIVYYQQRALRVGLDKTSVQMQLILNAALSYYNDTYMWPTSFSNLTTPNSKGVKYLSAIPQNPFGGSATAPYVIVTPNDPNSAGTTYPFFEVTVTLPFSGAKNAAAAQVVAGRLPMASSSGGTVTAYANAPGQALNRMTAAKYAGLYHHGACIPVPSCPPNMTPKVVLVPVSVSGVMTPLSGATSSFAYPISSFTAYVQGCADPRNCPSPSACYGTVGSVPACSPGGDSTTVAPTGYWRACLQLVTQNGDATTNNAVNPDPSWGQYVTMMAVTRCAIPGEKSGSSFSVYSN